MNKKILKIAAIVIAALFVLAIALPLFINVNRFRPEIESNISAALGRNVTLGDLSLSILSGSVEANQLAIADDPKFSNTPFIQAKSLKVGVELMPLIFSKQINVTHLILEKPQIALLRTRDGVWNFSSLGAHAGDTVEGAWEKRWFRASKPKRRQARNQRWNDFRRFRPRAPRSHRL